MPNDNPELFDPNEESDNPTLPDADTGIDTDGTDDAQQALVSGAKKSAFLDSQLAKTLFDVLGIDPEEYTDEADLIAEFTLRLTSMVTLQRRLLAALGIDETDRNKFELLSVKVTALVEFLDQYDHDDDGMVDEEDVMQGAQPTAGGDETIDGTLGKLEANDQNLQLSLNSLQKKYAESATVIKSLVAQNRQLRLDNMLQGGEINKATHQKAVKNFVLKLSLNDGFDTFIDGAKTNSRPSTGHSKTPAQHAPPKPDATASWTEAAKKVTAPYGRGE